MRLEAGAASLSGKIQTQLFRTIPTIPFLHYKFEPLLDYAGMNRRTATRSSGSLAIRGDTRRKSKDEAEKGMWSSMLDSVASGRKLPEKNLIVLGRFPPIRTSFTAEEKKQAGPQPCRKNS